MRPIFLFGILFCAAAPVGCGRPKSTDAADEAPDDAPVGTPAGVAAAPPPRPAPPKAPAEPARLSVKERWRSGHVTVEVADGAMHVDEESLYVMMQVGVDDEKRTAEFRSWRHVGAAAADNYGNKLGVRRFDQLADVLLPAHLSESLRRNVAYGAGTVNFDRPRVVYLVFTRPAPAATAIDLDLDARHVGATGTIRFRIAASEMKPW